MEYRRLGGTGVEVSTYCLGTMMFGGWGNPDVDACTGMIHRALDAGINLIDTADVYSNGDSERIVGAALTGHRDEVLLATKCHMPMGDSRLRRGNSRRWIMRAVEESLRRLGTDHIDLYQIHRYDPATDLDETLGALTDLVREGKVRYLGSSTFPAHVVVEAQSISQRRNLGRLVCEQPPYSIMVRHPEADLFDVLQRHRMGAITWAPLRGGWLAGRYREGEPPPPGSRSDRRMSERASDRYDITLGEHAWKYDAVERLATIADTAGTSLTHLAVNWTLHHPAVTATILGPRTPEQLDDLLAGAGRRLDDETLDAIDEVVPPGTTPSSSDRGWDPPWLRPEARRRPGR